MRRLLWLFLAAGFLRADDGYTVSGHLVYAANRRPVGKALVTLTAQNRKDVSVVSGPDGSFHFVHVPAGKYVLETETRDGRVQQYQAHGAFSTGIVTGPNQNTQGIVFSIEALGSISGTILSDSGEPVPNATAYAYRKGVQGGRYRYEVSGRTAASDSDGAFHLEGLEAGTYVLAVVARPWFAQSGNNAGPDTDVAYPVTYFGDTTEFRAARPIVLPSGETLDATVHLRTVPALHLSMPKGNFVPQFWLSDVPPEIFLNVPTTQTGRSDGVAGIQMEVTGIPPGNYRVDVRQFSPDGIGKQGSVQMSIQSNATLPAIEWKQPTVIAGHVLAPEGSRLAGPVAVNTSCGGAALSDKDGAFFIQFQQVLSSHCSIAVASLSDSALAFQSMSLNGAAFRAEDSFDLPDSGGRVQLDIRTARTPPHTLEGIAMDGDKPASGAAVWLIPENSTEESRVRRDQSDSDGSFRLTGVLPGKYQLFVIENGHDLAYFEPGVMKPYLAQVVSVVVSEADDKPLRAPLQKLVRDQAF